MYGFRMNTRNDVGSKNTNSESKLRGEVKIQHFFES